jgi:hypothetical protein
MCITRYTVGIFCSCLVAQVKQFLMGNFWIHETAVTHMRGASAKGIVEEKVLLFLDPVGEAEGGMMLLRKLALMLGLRGLKFRSQI